MRKLIYFLVLATLVWSGYWFVGSSALRQGAEQWFADQAERGLTVEKTGLRITGFPNRFDMTVDGLRLGDPRSGTIWQAPFVQVFAMTWKPWHIIAAMPPEQMLTVEGQDITLTSQGMRASLRAQPSLDLPLAAAIVESGAFTATSNAGWTVGADSAVASILAADGQPTAYNLSLDVANLVPDPVLMARLTAESGLPGTVSTLQLRAVARFSAPLDRNAPQTQPVLMGFDLAQAMLLWGDLSVTATGSILPDDAGFAAGRIEIAVTNYQRLVPTLVSAGVIKPELSLTVGNMLAALAQDSGDPNQLQLPLVLEGGRISFGPLPLGTAPRMLPPSG